MFKEEYFGIPSEWFIPLCILVLTVALPIVSGSFIWGCRQIGSLLGSRREFPKNPKTCLHARLVPIQSPDGKDGFQVDLFRDLGGSIPTTL